MEDERRLTNPQQLVALVTRVDTLSCFDTLENYVTPRSWTPSQATDVNTLPAGQTFSPLQFAVRVYDCGSMQIESVNWLIGCSSVLIAGEQKVPAL